MKNDFDFIKDKIKNSGVNAPEDMDERFVMEKLDGVQPDTAPVLTELKPKKRRAGMITGIAAAFVAVAALSVFGAVYFANRNTESLPELTMPGNGITGQSAVIRPSVSADVPLVTFNSYDEVKEQMEKAAEKYGDSLYTNERYMAVDDMAMADSESAKSGNSSGSSGSSSNQSAASGLDTSSGSDSYSETYRQVEGVDEADIVKTDGRYLYIVESGSRECVRVYSATDKPKQVATINPAGYENPAATLDEASSEGYDPYVFVREMFLSDGKLVVICQTRDNYYNYDTAAMVYDVTDIKHVKLLDQLHQSGDYTTSRMIGDTLYLISQKSFYNYYDDEYDKDDLDIPVCYRGTVKSEIPIDCVYSVKEPTENNMLIVGGYSLADGSKDVHPSALIGSVQDVYCNESNMYLYAAEWNQYYIAENYGVYERDETDSDILPQYEPMKTGVYKVSLKDGIAFTAYGKVEGTLNSRYSLDEKNGYLRVAATTEDKYWHESNRLYILDSSLKEVGRVEDFAKNESIKAVRYVGDVAYVITYEQTDPLFVIDVGDPKAPKILGEVKIDGFSSMLVPVDDNTILGLGYYTEEADYTDMQVQNGFKLALFDVSDKLNPKVLDEKVYRCYYSPVMNEPRALVYNPDRGDYLIPLNYEDYHLGEDIEYYMPDIRGGALNFKVENGKLVEISHPEVNVDNSDADLIERCLYVGDNIYMISNGDYQDVKVYTAKYR